jgi:hypothetical protein
MKDDWGEAIAPLVDGAPWYENAIAPSVLKAPIDITTILLDSKGKLPWVDQALLLRSLCLCHEGYIQQASECTCQAHFGCISSSPKDAPLKPGESSLSSHRSIFDRYPFWRRE